MPPTRRHEDPIDNILEEILCWILVRAFLFQTVACVVLYVIYRVSPTLSAITLLWLVVAFGCQAVIRTPRRR